MGKERGLLKRNKLWNWEFRNPPISAGSLREPNWHCGAAFGRKCDNSFESFSKSLKVIVVPAMRNRKWITLCGRVPVA